MKYFYTLLIAIALTGANLFAQEDYTSENESAVAIFSFDRNRIFQGASLGFTGLSYGSDFMNTTVPDESKFFDVNMGNSITWEINPVEVDIRIVNEYFKVATGLGYMAKNFSLENNYMLYRDSNDVVTGTQLAEPTLKRNRFRTGYLTLPVFLYANTNRNPIKAFRFGVGVVGGIRLFQTYRRKWEDDGHTVKSNKNNNWNTNLFMLDARAVIGFGPLNIAFSYGLMPLFESGKGPEVAPFYVSIILTGYDN